MEGRELMLAVFAAGVSVGVVIGVFWALMTLEK